MREKPKVNECNTCGKSLESKTNGLWTCKECFKWKFEGI